MIIDEDQICHLTFFTLNNVNFQTIISVILSDGQVQVSPANV